MSPLYVLLGTNLALAQAEINALLKRHALNTPLITTTHPHLFALSLPQTILQNLAAISGSLVKVMSPISVKDDNLALSIATHLSATPHPNFLIHDLNTHNEAGLSRQVKALLIGQGLKPHFRLDPSLFVSSGIGQKFTEYTILDASTLLVTSWTQDLYHWRHKDRGKPASDVKKGMLPPKIARIMCNLALQEVALDSHPIVYDPFCGTGTILMEALELGCQPVGSDLDAQAVGMARQNLDWFIGQINSKTTVRLFQADAQHLSPSLFAASPDAVVFEGHLGPQFLRPEKIPGLVKGLTKLYTGVLKRVYPILKPHGVMVMALPQYKVSGRVKNLSGLVDSCEKYGYTMVGQPIIYGRPRAIVKRQVITLQKKSILQK